MSDPNQEVEDQQAPNLSRFKGKLFFRDRPSREAIEAGEHYYCAEHPIFLLIPLALAVITAAINIISAKSGTGSSVLGYVSFAATLAALGWFIYKVLIVEASYIVADKDHIYVWSGIIRRHAVEIPQNRITDENYVGPPLGFRWLHFFSFTAETAGDIINPKVRRLQYIRELSQILKGINRDKVTRTEKIQVDQLEALRSIESLLRGLGGKLNRQNELLLALSPRFHSDQPTIELPAIQPESQPSTAASDPPLPDETSDPD